MVLSVSMRKLLPQLVHGFSLSTYPDCWVAPAFWHQSSETTTRAEMP